MGSADTSKRKPGRPPDPATPGEWQEAADVASLYRSLADASMYGLLEGSLFEHDRRRRADRGWYGKINLARCDYILDKAARRQIFPKPFEQLWKIYGPALNVEQPDPIAAAAAAATPHIGGPHDAKAVG